MRSKIGALPLTVSTYDSNGQKIDQITAKSVDIHTDKKMSQQDDKGKENSSVIDVDYGNNRMIHVGSTLIAYEGLKNYQDAFSKHVNINNQNHSVPILNTMYQNFKNDWAGNSKIVMIRSQLGMPVAAFAGKHVSIYKSDMKNATQFVIDGHRLFVYRADYTIYPIASLKK
ncbi:diaphanous-like protein [Lactobacillus intestinalis DSM 6629]|uniref:Diaphanous-like protein n=2 Tax=Lactobacillus intestinalis TaxID=151781 RepID=A0ABR5PRK6_9LACO|nr:diaphanous-like protein [Lactobacillus intestinalis DSM 6629]